jgi:ubiquinone/menaquinone biosynthesis C-methylase UbiE
MRPPEIQTYKDLAREYDERRYVSDTATLVEGFRRTALTSLMPRDVGRALDVACGTGRGVVILREHAKKAFGVDGTHEMLAIAREKTDAAGNRPPVCQANAAVLPFADGTFDLVTCLNFVHLFEKDAKRAFITEIGRVLKPGGVAIVEFDNALLGFGLGVVRKYFGKDIGYDWPWVMRASFRPDLFRITQMRGANLPGIWRVPFLRGLERATSRFPLSQLAARTFVRAVRR